MREWAVRESPERREQENRETEADEKKNSEREQKRMNRQRNVRNRTALRGLGTGCAACILILAMILSGFRGTAYGAIVRATSSNAEKEEARREKEDRDSKKNREPLLAVQAIGDQSPLKAGEEKNVKFSVENLYRHGDVENVVMSFETSDQIYLTLDQASTIIRKLDGKDKKNFWVSVRAAEEITQNMQHINITLKYDYYDEDGDRQQGSTTGRILIPVTPSTMKTGDPMVMVERSDVGIIAPGQEFGVDVFVKNLSGDVRLEKLLATAETGDGLVLMEQSSTKYLKDIGPEETASFHLTLRAGAVQEQPAQAISISLKYEFVKGGSRGQGTSADKIMIPMVTNGAKKTGSASPNVIISRYQYPEQIHIGDQFQLDLTFQNTSRALTAENIVMSMDTGEGLSITASSNTFYIPALKPGEEHSERIPLEALANSKYGSAKLDINFRFEYVDQNQRSQSTMGEKIAIPIFQPDRFKVSPPELVEAAAAGEEFTLSLPYVNKGKIDVSNVEAELSGEAEVLSRHQNLGNFEPGKAGTIDFILTPVKSGRQIFTVSVTYEDAAMKEKKIEIPVELDVKEARHDGAEDMPEDMGAYPEEPGIGGGLKLALIFGGVLSGGAVLLVLVKRKLRKRRLKKEAEADDGWDDEEPESSRRTEQEGQESNESK